MLQASKPTYEHPSFKLPEGDYWKSCEFKLNLVISNSQFLRKTITVRRLRHDLLEPRAGQISTA